MNDPPEVSDDEVLARFITQRNHIRGDNTVKPNAFIPHPWPNLSVTRHTGLDEDEIWEIGQQVADARPATLRGRADVLELTPERKRVVLQELDSILRSRQSGLTPAQIDEQLTLFECTARDGSTFDPLKQLRQQQRVAPR